MGEVSGQLCGGSVRVIENRQFLRAAFEEILPHKSSSTPVNHLAEEKAYVSMDILIGQLISYPL